MYFKRPSFRRGGSTGIGQLTPRTQARGGGNIGGGLFTGSNLGTRTGFQEILGISEAMLEELNRGKPNYSMKAPTSNLGRLLLTNPKTVYGTGIGAGAAAGTGIALLADAYQKATKTPLAYKKLKEVSKRPYYFDETNLDFAEGLDEIRAANEIGEAPGFFPRGGKKKFYEDKNLDPETGLVIEDRGFLPTPRFDSDQTVNMESIVEEMVPNKKIDEDTPKEPTFEDTYEIEKSRIEKLIGDDDQKGMAAIALSEAIGTPGTLADKAAVLNKSLLALMGNKKKDKKDIAMLAYKATKEIEKAKIVAGKKTDSAKNFEEIKSLNRIIQDDTGTYNEDQKKNARSRLNVISESIKVLNPAKETGLSSVDAKAIQGLDVLATKLARLDKDSAGYKKAFDQYLRARIVVLKNRNLADLVALSDAQVGLEFKKDGGRIGLANGSPIEQITETETVETSGTPTVQVTQLSFEELRDRLPPEVTDDVIRFLSQSEQALQDFAYIRTAGDIKKFNMKYGLNLVLPAQA